MIKVKNEFINLYEELSKLNEEAEAAPSAPATEEDWDKLFEKAPAELDYDDMDVSVEADGKTGVIRYYTYDIGWESYPERMEACVADMLRKPAGEITGADLAAIDEGELYEFAKDYFFDKALAELEKKVERGDYEYDSVSWDEGWGW